VRRKAGSSGVGQLFIFLFIFVRFQTYFRKVRVICSFEISPEVGIAFVSVPEPVVVFHDRLRRVSLKLSMLAESKILVKVDIGAEYFFDIQVEYM
jgi:hypothetical protein